MKIFLSILLSIVITSVSTAQYDEAIKAQAAEYNTAFLEQNYEAYVDKTIPAIVTLGGGKASMISVAKEEASVYEGTDMKIASIEPVAIGKVYQSEGALHVILGQQKTINVEGKKFQNITNYLAESSDEGATWSFLDLEPYDIESLRLFIPGLSKDIELPTVDDALLLKE